MCRVISIYFPTLIAYFHYLKMHRPIDIIPLITEAAQDKKGSKITIVDLSRIPSATTGAFVICQGRSPSQVSAIADNIRDKVLADAARKPYGYDGYRNSEWIVIDYGEVVAHVFLPEARSHYDLEGLWADASLTEIPDLD